VCAPLYEGRRGHHGFVGCGVELDHAHPNSVFNTYMANITLTQVGHGGEERTYIPIQLDTIHANLNLHNTSDSTVNKPSEYDDYDEYDQQYDDFGHHDSFQQSDEFKRQEMWENWE